MAAAMRGCSSKNRPTSTSPFREVRLTASRNSMTCSALIDIPPRTAPVNVGAANPHTLYAAVNAVRISIK